MKRGGRREGETRLKPPACFLTKLRDGVVCAGVEVLILPCNDPHVLLRSLPHLRPYQPAINTINTFSLPHLQSTQYRLSHPPSVPVPRSSSSHIVILSHYLERRDGGSRTCFVFRNFYSMYFYYTNKRTDG